MLTAYDKAHTFFFIDMEVCMKRFIKVMKALSDSNRVKMVKLFQHKVMCVCEIQSAMGLAQSTASKHLKILEEAGLITYHKEGCGSIIAWRWLR